jgi:hypothetical protein
MNMTEQTLEQAALDYLAKGLTVIPIRGRYAKTLDEAKRPLVQWQKWQGLRPTEAVVKNWFAKKPLADIGLLTGPENGLLALDVDGEKGFQSIADRPISDTWISLTRRGSHYLFNWDQRFSAVASTKVGVLPGCDVRGRGGYIVCPPSVGVGDFQYTWKPGYGPEEQQLANPPEWLVQELLKQEAKAYSDVSTASPNWYDEVKDGVGSGERHKFLCKLTSLYMSRGIPEEAVITLMRDWNSKCTPPKAEEAFEKELDEFLDEWRSGRYKSTHKIVTEFTVQKSDEFVSAGPVKVDWLVDGIIPVETIGFLHGYGGLGKSWMALDLAIEVGRKSGGKWLDRWPTTVGKVLYIDEESHPTLLRQRYSALLAAKGVDAKDVAVSFLSLSGLKIDNRESLEAFKGLLVEMQPELVIIDPFVSLTSLNENSTQDMARVRDILKGIIRDCSCGFLIIDHEGKPGMIEKTAAQRQRGSSEKDAVADVKLGLSKDANGELLVEHSKARFSAAHAPFNIELVDLEMGKTVVRFKGYPNA